MGAALGLAGSERLAGCGRLACVLSAMASRVLQGAQQGALKGGGGAGLLTARSLRRARRHATRQGPLCRLRPVRHHFFFLARLLDDGFSFGSSFSYFSGGGSSFLS